MAKSTLEIECPGCGASDSVLIDDTLNTVKQPEELKALLNGTYFTYLCPHCGTPMHVGHGVLYHDPENRRMCFLCPDEESVRNAVSSLKAAGNTREGMSLKDYTIRIEMLERRLEEKALIWELGLDDKAVEMWKLTYMYQVVSHNEDFEADDSCLARQGDGFRIDYYLQGEYVTSLHADISLVEGVKQRFLSTPLPEEVNDLFVDQAWAMQHLTALLHRPDTITSKDSD